MENDETREKLGMCGVKFLRLARRFGLAEEARGMTTSRAEQVRLPISFDRASAMAEQLEAGQNPLDFSCPIMVIGKTGVGKSATINSILNEVNKFKTDAFKLGTKKVHDTVRMVHGVKVRVIDIPLLRTVSGILGTSIWCNTVVVLTHAASAPPAGFVLSNETFVAQRCHAIWQAFRQAVVDPRLWSNNPAFSLVENNRCGETKFNNFSCNCTSAGVSATLLQDYIVGRGEN